MGKIIACIDGSAYSDHVCSLSAWAARRTGFSVSLLHVVAPHTEMAARADLSGSIGLGAKSGLLKELAEMDEAHGKLEQRKGQLMLDHAKAELAENGLQAEVLHRRGSLVETIAELEPHADLVVMGERGEHASNAPDHLGSNLERVARALHKPLLVASAHAETISSFLIAYDGGASTDKAVDYLVAQPLLKGLECHLLKVGEASAEARSMLQGAEEKLTRAGYTVRTTLRQGKPVEKLVADYIDEHGIDLLVIGAYGHSKIRSLILGSTTTALIRSSKTPILLFR